MVYKAVTLTFKYFWTWFLTLSTELSFFRKKTLKVVEGNSIARSSGQSGRSFR